MRRLLTLILPAAAGPAAARHAMDGAPMLTVGQGLVSGLVHPVLGADHLAFVLVAGVAAGLAGSPLRAPLAFVAALLAGGLLGPVPGGEALVALSLPGLGAVLAAGRRPGPVRCCSGAWRARRFSPDIAVA